jgi:hypothetical protein
MVIVLTAAISRESLEMVLLLTLEKEERAYRWAPLLKVFQSRKTQIYLRANINQPVGDHLPSVSLFTLFSFSFILFS